MTVALINASPKLSHSSSWALIKNTVGFFPNKTNVKMLDMHTNTVSENTVSELLAADAWVLFFPLYVDALPSHVLRCLMQLEERARGKTLKVYAVINCGFYEGEQTEVAFEIVENFCIRAGLEFCGGVGVGGGGMLSTTPVLEDMKHNKTAIIHELKRLAKSVVRGRNHGVKFKSVSIPRIMYKVGAEALWRINAVKYGNKLSDLGKRY